MYGNLLYSDVATIRKKSLAVLTDSRVLLPASMLNLKHLDLDNRMRSYFDYTVSATTRTVPELYSVPATIAMLALLGV